MIMLPAVENYTLLDLIWKQPAPRKITTLQKPNDSVCWHGNSETLLQKSLHQ